MSVAATETEIKEGAQAQEEAPMALQRQGR